MQNNQKTITNYKDLTVWQKSMDLVLEVYRVTEHFPKHEQYGLVSQMRRCAVSVPSNIAEGHQRSSRKDYRKFVLTSFGSGTELETQLLLAQRLNYCSQSDVSELNLLLEGVLKMLNKLSQALKKEPNQKPNL